VGYLCGFRVPRVISCEDDDVRSRELKAPAPRRWPIAGHIPQWRNDPVKLVTEAARLGDVVRLGLPGETYLLNHPRHVKHVLQDNHQNYEKGWVFDRIRPYWGESLLTAEGDTWRRQRRRVQPSFKREHTVAFAPTITTRTAEMLARWDQAAESGHALDVYNEMTQLALVIIGDVLFGVELWQDVSEMAGAVQTALRVLKNRVAALAPLPLWIPTGSNRRFNQAMRTLNDRVAHIVEQNRRGGEGSARNFVSALMRATDATGARMTDKQLHEEIIGMLQQGHDTIGETLAWTWYLLSLHPEVERKLRREVSHVLGDRMPTVADLDRLEYAAMVVQESMRLYPPVWVIPRDAIGDDEIGGYRIPRGSTVLLSPYLTHRHPEFWENPEAFDPERFSPERAKARPRHAYFPFGGGPRQCMGADMAMMETLLIMSMVVQKYRLHLVSCHREEPECILDMVPRHHVRATVHRQLPRVEPAVATHLSAPQDASPAAARCPFAAHA
jgi:cytochrome P450